MALDTELDGLIRRARAAEEPAAPVRADVRRRLQQQLDAGTHDSAFEEAVLAPEAKRWPRGLAWGVPLVGIAAVTLILLQLAPQTADPLVRAPQPAPLTAPPQPPAAAPGVAVAAAAAPGAAAAAPGVAVAAAAATAGSVATASAAAAPAAPAVASTAIHAPPPPTAVRAPRGPDLLAESQALARVQGALRDGEPARALQLLAQQEREFARGVLHEERAAARALALCDGPGAEGQRAAAAFAARYPQSVLGARVQSRCAFAREERE